MVLEAHRRDRARDAVGREWLGRLVGHEAVLMALMFVVVPGMKQWPDDVDTQRTYVGTMPVLLNAETGLPRCEWTWRRYARPSSWTWKLRGAMLAGMTVPA